VAGLCHSDLHIIDGMAARAARPGASFKPFALSHEIGGTVLAVGDGVDSVSVGKQYVLYPWLGCGGCIQCTDPTSDEVFCMGREMSPPLPSRTFGTGMNGGFASHLLVPDAKYLVDPGAIEERIISFAMPFCTKNDPCTKIGSGPM
jgi:D-arabinose 1-dehydrogenase-like Zn-dependent alcohol dehydrogenase